MTYGTVLALGDSLLYGARQEGDGIPERLAQALTDHDNRVEWASLNRTVCGETAWKVLQRAPAAARELASCPGAKWAVVMAGTNDTKAATSKCPPNHMQRALMQTWHWFRRHGLPTVLCTLPPVVPATMPCYSPASLDWIARINDLVRDYVRLRDGHGARLVLAELADLDPREHLLDGVHLSAEGNAEAARRIAAAMLGG